MTYERIELTSAGYNNHEYEINPAGVAMVERFKEIEAYHESGGTVYLEFLKGDREGSIAILEPRKSYNRWIFAEVRNTRSYFHHSNADRIEYDCRIYGQLRFTGKSHRPQVSVYPDGEIAWLKGYDGPTVWKKFDVKAAKEKIIAEVALTDIDGNVLKVGDEVLYIDIRYGSGAKLRHGKVERFDVTVNSERSETFTIITSEDGGESKISYPSAMVLKTN